MISGPAKDDCGEAITPIAAATVAPVLVKKARRSVSPTEKAEADEMQKSRATAARNVFMVLFFCSIIIFQRTVSL